MIKILCKRRWGKLGPLHRHTTVYVYESNGWLNHHDGDGPSLARWTTFWGRWNVWTVTSDLWVKNVVSPSVFNYHSDHAAWKMIYLKIRHHKKCWNNGHHQIPLLFSPHVCLLQRFVFKMKVKIKIHLWQSWMQRIKFQRPMVTATLMTSCYKLSVVSPLLLVVYHTFSVQRTLNAKEGSHLKKEKVAKHISCRWNLSLTRGYGGWTK